MMRAKKLVSFLRQSGWLAHSVRTAIAAAASLAFARLFDMPEPYWAAVTTLIVMQSTLGASWKISKRRIIGTALGAGLGGLLASYFEMNVILFGAAIFALGIICAALRLGPSAYRFAGVALTIVTLVAHGKTPPVVIAFQRFAEVFIGIVVALALSALWRARDVAPDP